MNKYNIKQVEVARETGKSFKIINFAYFQIILPIQVCLPIK